MVFLQVAQEFLAVHHQLRLDSAGEGLPGDRIPPLQGHLPGNYLHGLVKSNGHFQQRRPIRHRLRLGGFFGGGFGWSLGSLPGGGLGRGFSSFLSGGLGSLPGGGFGRFLSGCFGGLGRGRIGNQCGLGIQLPHQGDGYLSGDIGCPQGGVAVHNGAQVPSGGRRKLAHIRQAQVHIGTGVQYPQQGGQAELPPIFRIRGQKLHIPVGRGGFLPQHMDGQQTIEAVFRLAHQPDGVQLVFRIHKPGLAEDSVEQGRGEDKIDVPGLDAKPDGAPEGIIQPTQPLEAQGLLRLGALVDCGGDSQVKFCPGIRQEGNGSLVVFAGPDIGKQGKLSGRVHHDALREDQIAAPILGSLRVFCRFGFLRHGVRVRLPHGSLPGEDVPPFQGHIPLPGDRQGAVVLDAQQIACLLGGPQGLLVRHRGFFGGLGGLLGFFGGLLGLLCGLGGLLSLLRGAFRLLGGSLGFLGGSLRSRFRPQGFFGRGLRGGLGRRFRRSLGGCRSGLLGRGRFGDFRILRGRSNLLCPGREHRCIHKKRSCQQKGNDSVSLTGHSASFLSHNAIWKWAQAGQSGTKAAVT